MPPPRPAVVTEVSPVGDVTAGSAVDSSSVVARTDRIRRRSPRALRRWGVSSVGGLAAIGRWSAASASASAVAVESSGLVVDPGSGSCAGSFGPLGVVGGALVPSSVVAGGVVTTRSGSRARGGRARRLSGPWFRCRSLRLRRQWAAA